MKLAILSMLPAMICLALSACAPESYEGSLDEQSVDRLRETAVQDGDIVVSSTGGNPRYGHRFGQIVLERNLTVRFGEECSSSCAEFVLPSAAHRITGPNTLIGYHGSHWIGTWIDRTFYPEQTDGCDNEPMDYLRRTYAVRDLNPEAWREVVERLLIVGHEAEMQDGCLKTSFLKWTSIWFPTSAQMRNIFGYRDIETLCSDDEACWVPRLQSFGGPGTRYAVGDRFVRLTNDGRIVDFDPADLGDEFLVPDAAYAVEA